MQKKALFSWKIYTAGKNFTRPPVATVATNFKSARHNHQQGTKWAGKALPKMTKNAYFWPNLAVWGKKS